MGSLNWRKAKPEDVPALVRMANQLNRYEGCRPNLFTEHGLERELFGPDPVLSVIVAEQGGELVGYASYCEVYNSDIAARGLWGVDLFVTEHARGQGIGRRLAAAVAHIALERGALSIWAPVSTSNDRAMTFYRSCGGRDDNVRVLALDGDALDKLATEAGPA